MIRFGPAGLGGVNEAISNMEEYAESGLGACEIAFTYGIYMHNDQDAERIGKRAKELDIKLSIHAPYWINLNSAEQKKIEESKKRILDCCRIGEKLGAYLVIFHPGYYGKMEKGETYENIKKEILEIMGEIKKNGWKINIAPETTGKVNVFGSVEEIKKLVKDTGCAFCVDFAHVIARNLGKISYEEIAKEFSGFERIHAHFSGIEYGDKGERNHKKTAESDWKKLLSALPKKKEIVIINESPDCFEDSVNGLRLFKSI